MIYFKFNYQFEKSNNREYSFIEIISVKILSFILPKTNPDFEGKYNDVICWYIEFDKKNNYANREIGFDNRGEVIVIAPYKENLGFWLDTDLTLDNYEKFDLEMISADEFERFWEQF